MAKKSYQKVIKVRLNLDKGIEDWNKRNPNAPVPMTRQSVYEEEELTKATLQNWKNGKVPKAFIALFNFLERTECDLTKILEVQKDERHP